jgi:probable HAF family extracellular repeat protein
MAYYGLLRDFRSVSPVLAGASINDINAAGDVTGEADDGSPFLFGAGGLSIIDLPPGVPAGATGAGTRLNNASHVVGNFESTETMAFHCENGVTTNLHALIKNARSSDVCGINDAGQVIGEGWTKANKPMWWLYENKKMKDLGPDLVAALGDRRFVLEDINNHGDVLGWYLEDQTTEIHRGVTFIYSLKNKTAVTLAMGYVGYFLNDRGQVGGFRETDGGSFFYDGAFTALEGGSTMLTGMNNSGRLVGYPNDSGDKVPGLVWQPDGHVDDVNNLVDPPLAGQLGLVTAINDAGIIATHVDGEAFSDYHPVLLSPFVAPLERFAGAKAAITILNGIIQDAPGSGRTPDGRGHHVGPGPGDPGPVWRALSPWQRDLLLGFSIDELAGLLGNSQARLEIQRSARALLGATRPPGSGAGAASAATAGPSRAMPVSERPHISTSGVAVRPWRRALSRRVRAAKRSGAAVSDKQKRRRRRDT